MMSPEYPVTTTDLVKAYGSTDSAVRALDGVPVAITHDPTGAAYADRLLVLADGRIRDDPSSPSRAAVSCAPQTPVAAR